MEDETAVMMDGSRDSEEGALTDRCGCWTGLIPRETIMDGPVCHHWGFKISAQAMRTRLPFERQDDAETGFRFCATKWCPVVYFNNETEVYLARDDVLAGTWDKADYS